MRLGFLIIAHDKFPQLDLFVKQLLEYPNSRVYIMIDAKVSHERISSLSILKNPRVMIYENRIRIEWGDYSQIKATIKLMEAASKDRLDYVSLCSGADLFIKPVANFAQYLKSSGAGVYIDASKMPIKNFGYGWGGFERIVIRYPNWMRKKLKKSNPIRYMRTIYQIFGSKVSKALQGQRHITKSVDYYYGSQWFTINKSVLHKTLQYLKKNPNFSKPFESGLSPDEIFFNTVFMMPVVSQGEIINNMDNLRYIDWSVSNSNDSGSPKTLSIEDYQSLLDSPKYIARKFDMQTNPEIVKKILSRHARKRLEGGV